MFYYFKQLMYIIYVCVWSGVEGILYNLLLLLEL